MQDRWNHLKDELELIKQLRNRPSQPRIRTNLVSSDIFSFPIICDESCDYFCGSCTPQVEVEFLGRVWVRTSGYFLTVTSYRPQRSCEGYVFTPVCLSTVRGGLLQCMLGYPPPEQALPQQTATVRTVRILLECILVFKFPSRNLHK